MSLGCCFLCPTLNALLTCISEVGLAIVLWHHPSPTDYVSWTVSPQAPSLLSATRSTSCSCSVAPQSPHIVHARSLFSPPCYHMLPYNVRICCVIEPNEVIYVLLSSVCMCMSTNIFAVTCCHPSSSSSEHARFTCPLRAHRFSCTVTFVDTPGTMLST